MFNSLEEFDRPQEPIALTIGNFDGVHLGHQHVLKQLRETARKSKVHSAVITFSNPPSIVLHPEKPVLMLTSQKQKQHLIRNLGIEFIISLEFTKEFSQQSPETFLNRICDRVNLKHLVLGYDSRIGKGRAGDKQTVQNYASKHDMALDYVSPFLFDGLPVSSSRVRALIQKGDLAGAEKLLGRKYSQLLTPRTGRGLGRSIGYSTLNFDVHGICLPPIGVYSVLVKLGDHIYDSVANLGFAPTVRDDDFPQLEVHLLDETKDINHNEVEVIFHRRIREERKFETLEDLREQIGKDIETAKNQLKVL